MRCFKASLAKGGGFCRRQKTVGLIFYGSVGCLAPTADTESVARPVRATQSLPLCPKGRCLVYARRRGWKAWLSLWESWLRSRLRGYVSDGQILFAPAKRIWKEKQAKEGRAMPLFGNTLGAQRETALRHIINIQYLVCEPRHPLSRCCLEAPARRHGNFSSLYFRREQAPPYAWSAKLHIPTRRGRRPQRPVGDAVNFV